MHKKEPIRKILKLIAVDEKQYSRLREHGKTPMSFNDIIRELLDEIEKKKNEKALETPLTN